jgi:hypothetical protein
MWVLCENIIQFWKKKEVLLCHYHQHPRYSYDRKKKRAYKLSSAGEPHLNERCSVLALSYFVQKVGPIAKSNVQLTLRPAGFEPATFGLGNRCSILLSYGRITIKRLLWNCRQVLYTLNFNIARKSDLRYTL